MDTEKPALKGSRRFSQRHAAYLFSACLHAALACAVWTMLPDQVKVADVVLVELVELPSMGPKGCGQLSGSPAPGGIGPGLLSPARPDNRLESLHFKIREPEPASKTVKQDRENADKTAAAETLDSQETKDTLPDGGFQGGSSDRQNSEGKGGGSSERQGNGGSSDGHGNGGKAQGLQNSGNGLPKFDFQAYQAAVRARIEAAKQYPMAARKRHLEGNVIISFRLSRKGKVITTEIVKSSGNELLEKAALSAVQDGAPYPIYPSTDNEIPPSMTVNISFILN
jgi:TonB family protein